MARTTTRKNAVVADTPADEETIAATNAVPDADLTPDDEAAPAKKPKKTKVWEPLAGDRAAWVAAHARPAVSDCLCGCGKTTKGRFAPGHDATLHQALRATAIGEDADAATAATLALAAFGWDQ